MQMMSLSGAFLRSAQVLGLLALASHPAYSQALIDEITIVNAWFDDDASLRAVTPFLGHAQIDRDKGVLRTEADAELRRALKAAGMRVETDIEGTLANRRLFNAERVGMKSIPGFACYRTVEETEATMQSLVASAPSLAEIIDIGPSWQASQGLGGYQLKVLRVTNRSIVGPKPKVFIMTSVHAREYTPAEFSTRFVEQLINAYGVDADATWLIDHHEIHALLQANPDGRKRAETGLSWRKNTNSNFCGGGNSAGVDLNRNFPFEWGNWNGSSNAVCDGTYRGPAAQSEPETQAIVAYARSIFEDRRAPEFSAPAPADTPGIFFDVHSFSGLVLWPWGMFTGDSPNSVAFEAIGRRLAWFNRYTPQQSVGLYPTDGTTDDFAYGDLGVASFTFELGSAFFQDCASFESTVYPDNRRALLYALRSARAPYQLPAGPDVYAMGVTPDLALVGESVTVNATFDDLRQREGSFTEAGAQPATQNIVSASAYLSVPPWQAGAAAQAMQPSDGAFDAKVEIAQRGISTGTLPAGRHLLYVQGRDSAGNDGPPAATFIDLRAPQDVFTLAGTVREFGTQTPLEATISAGMFTSQTDPNDGSYQRRLPLGTYSVAYAAEGHETDVRSGVSGQGGQTLASDVQLYRLCGLLTDPVDLAITSPLTAQTPPTLWTRRAGGVNGGFIWLPSVSGSYANNQNTALSSAVVDLSGYAGAQLTFDQRCDTEAGYDFGRVEISTSGGSSWSEVFRCNGETQWRRVTLALPQLDGASNARLRFRFTSDSSQVASGWALDNITLRAGGAICRASQGDPRGVPFHNGFEAVGVR